MRIILTDGAVIDGEGPLEIVKTLARRDHEITYEAKVQERMEHSRDRGQAEAKLARDYMEVTRMRILEQYGVELQERMPLGFLRDLHGLGIIEEIQE